MAVNNNHRETRFEINTHQNDGVEHVGYWDIDFKLFISGKTDSETSVFGWILQNF